MRKLTVNRNLGEANGWSQVDFMDKLEAAYLTGRRKTQKMKKTSFAPSSIGYKHNRCPRRWFYAFSGEHIVEDESDAIGVATMAAGRAAHERIQQAMEDAGMVTSLEFELKNIDPPIRGFVDCILEFEGKPLVGEIKTTMQEAFMWRLGKNAGADYHMYQVLLYMRLLNIEDGFLLYENKSSNELLVIPVKMTEENAVAIDDALQWMRDVWKAHEENKLPARKFTFKSKECKGCEFYKACWNDERDADVDLPAMKVAF